MDLEADISGIAHIFEHSMSPNAGVIAGSEETSMQKQTRKIKRFVIISFFSNIHLKPSNIRRQLVRKSQISSSIKKVSSFSFFFVSKSYGKKPFLFRLVFTFSMTIPWVKMN